MRFVRPVMALITCLCSAASAGCGSDCETVCEESRECPGADDFFEGVDCGDLCDLAEDFADAQGCLEEFEELNACGAAADDVCTSTDCQAEAQAYSECGDDD